MRNKKGIIIRSFNAVGLVAVITAGASWRIREVRANSLPTAVESQTSFGTVGLSIGQTMRVSVANTYAPPCRVLINFRDMDGDLIRNRNGQVIFRDVQLDPGQSAYLDLNFGQLPTALGTTFTTRVQLRPVINTQLGSPLPDGYPPPCVPVVEVFDSITGRTQFVIAGLPAVQPVTPVIGTN